MGIQQFRLEGPIPVHAYCIERVTRSERREGANRDGNGVEGGRGRGGDGGEVDARNELTGMGTEAGMETRAAAEDGNRDGSRNRDWCGDGNEDWSGNGNVDWSGDGNGNDNGEGREERGISDTRHTRK